MNHELLVNCSLYAFLSDLANCSLLSRLASYIEPPLKLQHLKLNYRIFLCLLYSSHFLQHPYVLIVLPHQFSNLQYVLVSIVLLTMLKRVTVFLQAYRIPHLFSPILYLDANERAVALKGGHAHQATILAPESIRKLVIVDVVNVSGKKTLRILPNLKQNVFSTVIKLIVF